MRRFLLIGIFGFLFGITFGQGQHNFFSRSELGPTIGGMFYLGDLNQFKPFYKSNLAGGIMYRYYHEPRLAFRGKFTIGNVEAYDSDSKNPLLLNRNLDFQSQIIELSAGLEFNYWPFQVGSKKYPATAYMLVGIGGFYMNPYTVVDGDKVYLQPLGTEGQGSPLGGRKYSNYQLCVPLGLGFKVTLGKVASFNVEMAIRKTFTDYLDDVKSAYYLDPALLAQANGQQAADLSNKSLDNSRFGRRGNPATKDWYVYFGGTLAFRLGKGSTCWHE